MRPPLSLAPARVEVIERDDGTTIVRSPVALEPYARCVTDWLDRWAEERPRKTFLAERAPGGELVRWSYGHVHLTAATTRRARHQAP